MLSFTLSTVYLQVLKWNFSAPRPEFIDQLRQQMEPTFNKTLVDQMLHIDFKFHIKAIDTLSKVSDTNVSLVLIT